MLNECNLRNHCLDVEVFNPMFINGQRTRHIYVTEVLNPDLIEGMIRELPSVSNDYEGSIQVRGFVTSPNDMCTIEIDLNNIDRISEIG